MPSVCLQGGYKLCSRFMKQKKTYTAILTVYVFFRPIPKLLVIFFVVERIFDAQYYNLIEQ